LFGTPFLVLNEYMELIVYKLITKKVTLGNVDMAGFIVCYKNLTFNLLVKIPI